MLQSVVETEHAFSSFPELQRARVLITGLSTMAGLEVARAFADQNARLVLQMDETTSETEIMLEVLALSADEIQVASRPLASETNAVSFAQRAAQAYGGLDVVVNLIGGASATGAETVDEIEAAVADRLRAASLVTRIAANRMRLTWSEGLVLNVLLPTPPTYRAANAFDAMARGALATMTRSEALAWARDGIRINAVGPRAALSGELRDCLKGEAEVAALAMFLASRRGRGLSGQIFDLDHVCTGR
jgi:3-oxoacyl-[acyl-carrier protein] reductase